MNAKKELLDLLNSIKKGVEDIDYTKVIFITVLKGWIETPEILSTTDAETLLSFLDREYNNGFGEQLLYGMIVFKDKTWLERQSYDGAEWWVHKEYPTKEYLENTNFVNLLEYE